MQLFYNPELTASSSSFSFSKEESKHIVKVLRKSVGDQLKITNGKGYMFDAKIEFVSSNKCIAQIVSTQKQPKRHFNLHLAVAPTKMNDRYEWFLEKATEIGIESITPIICDRSERKVVKTERLERIVQSAMKQSLNCYLPKLNPAINFNAFFEQKFEGQLFIAHCKESDKKSLKKELRPKTDITILIGPEGDFSSYEIDLAILNHFIPVTLGETRLRTETAAVVACHSVAFVNQL